MLGYPASEKPLADPHKEENPPELFTQGSGKKNSGKALPGFSGSTLKLIAACSMLLDHIGVAWIKRGILKNGRPAWLLHLWKAGTREDWQEAELLLRCAGRLAFPIFAFFLVEGFCHSKHRKRYGLRLFGFALVTEVVFDLAIFGQWFYPGYQNVLFTLLIAFVSLWGIERSRMDSGRMLFWIGAGCGAAFLLRTDYGAWGVMLILVLYWFRGSRSQLFAGVVMTALRGMTIWKCLLPALAFLLLAGYNGERGRWPGKYFFYLFYPGHLLFLYLARAWG